MAINATQRHSEALETNKVDVSSALDLMEKGQHEINQVSRMICGFRWIADVMENLAQPCNEGAFGTYAEQGCDLAQLLGVMSDIAHEKLSLIQEEHLDKVRIDITKLRGAL